MRQRLTIILTFAVIIGLLALVSSIRYVKKEKQQDFEIAPNRSTYHSGPTGVRAFYDFLHESGYKVVRWRDTPQKLLTDSGQAIKTFVVVGQVQVRFTDAEWEALTRWISAGGCYVVIDRHPLSEEKQPPSKINWDIVSRQLEFPSFDVNPADVQQMTGTVTALQPVQPTVYTQNIQSVLPSRFAARMTIEPPTEVQHNPETTTNSPAPVVHIADDKGALLIDYTYGAGRVVL